VAQGTRKRRLHLHRSKLLNSKIEVLDTLDALIGVMLEEQLRRFTRSTLMKPRGSSSMASSSVNARTSPISAIDT
jgi:hypothetical protein